MTGADRLLAACHCQPVDATPVWFMRQAGGSLPGYVALRGRHSVVEIAKTPRLCAEVSAGAVDALGVDGAVMFADIMLAVEAMGVAVDLTPAGPVIATPVVTRDAIDSLRDVDPETDLGFVLEAIRLVRAGLDGRAAVIGIAGGPFTLAAYLIEGAPSRDQLRARAFMHAEPEAWHALLARITSVTIDYVRAQIGAGAQVIQLFDSWAGSLPAADYARFVRPYAARILGAIDAVPSIHFAADSAAFLETFASAGGDVIGVDARQSIASVRDRIGQGRAVQGNLDPARVLAGREVTETGARTVLADAGALPGHVFNLGHASPRDADPHILRDLVTLVHDVSASSIGAREGAPFTPSQELATHA